MADADTTPEVWLIRGEGGDITPMSPPFGEGIEQRLRTGALVRVNPDGSRWEADTPAPDNAGSLVAKRAAEARAEAASKPPLPRPAKQAGKPKWVDYAVSTGQITEAAAEDLTKDELIERFGGD